MSAGAKSQQRQRADAQRNAGSHADPSRAGRERVSYGRALDARERKEEASFKPMYMPPEQKRPKGGIVAVVIVIIALVLIALFVFPGFLKGCSSDEGAPSAPAQGSSAVEASSATSSSAVTFSAAKAEAAARDAALDAGKQVLSGTVRVTTVGEQSANASEAVAGEFADSDEQLVLLEFDGVRSLEARDAAETI